ncbi:unnamed protein product [Dimorphilus gyrociliatus]|uniref:Uncharacterized protein n=1 Tax=Dimorphilus gyrociliatus TaxID=2664684 RepID=A0A7I8VF19_9ANNE|nr:unnamed protein product [Dimorphilus gyrociliatus]
MSKKDKLRSHYGGLITTSKTKQSRQLHHWNSWPTSKLLPPIIRQVSNGRNGKEHNDGKEKDVLKCLPKISFTKSKEPPPRPRSKSYDYSTVAFLPPFNLNLTPKASPRLSEESLASRTKSVKPVERSPEIRRSDADSVCSQETFEKCWKWIESLPRKFSGLSDVISKPEPDF